MNAKKTKEVNQSAPAAESEAAQPTEDQIVSALAQSGYLFEHDVATLLSDLGFHVETSWAFADRDTDKSREIDVRAVKRLATYEKHNLQVFIELLVECKDFASPLVFLERPKNERELVPDEPKEYIFPFRIMQQRTNATSYREVPAFSHLDLGQHHYYFCERNKATQFAKIVRKGSQWVANHDGIYDSLVLPLAKLLEIRRLDILRFARGPRTFFVGCFSPWSCSATTCRYTISRGRPLSCTSEVESVLFGTSTQKR